MRGIACGILRLLCRVGLVTAAFTALVMYVALCDRPTVRFHFSTHRHVFCFPTMCSLYPLVYHPTYIRGVTLGALDEASVNVWIYAEDMKAAAGSAAAVACVRYRKVEAGAAADSTWTQAPLCILDPESSTAVVQNQPTCVLDSPSHAKSSHYLLFPLGRFPFTT
jgi:hypothetical protein